MPLVADEGRGVFHFVDDPCLQPLEHMEVPSGDHHPPVRLDREERLLQGVRELQAVHICRSSVGAVCRHLSTAGFMFPMRRWHQVWDAGTLTAHTAYQATK